MCGYEETIGEWDRFDSYARRVQTWFKPTRETRFYIEMAQRRPNVLSFPSLHEVGLRDNSLASDILFPPSLRRLNIFFSYWQKSDVWNCIEAVSKQAPFLEVLCAYGPTHMTAIACLTELRYLHTLHMGAAEFLPGVMALLSRLPSLTTLELPRGGWDDTALDAGFPNLHCITLSAHSMQVIVFIESLITTSLHSITICNSPLDIAPCSTTQWRVCFVTIRKLFKYSLRSVLITTTIREDEMSGREMVEPLLDLHCLEEVRLSVSVALGMQDLSDMSLAWPLLQHIALRLPIVPDYHKLSNGIQPSTIHCLSFFARRCPRLASIEAEFHDIHLATTSEFPPFTHGLQKLCLYTPNVRDYTHLASLVDRLFPMLVEIKVNNGKVARGPPNDILCPNWLDVPDLIRHFQEVRAEQMS